MDKTEQDNLDFVLRTLTFREREVIEMRYGLSDCPRQGYDQIAARLCITPERVRQIEAKAIRKLGHPIRWRLLPEPMAALSMAALFMAQ